MQTRLPQTKRLAFSACTALFLGFCRIASVTGADYFISTQADFDANRQATFAPGDNVFFERGKVFHGMFAPTAVGTSRNPITISAFGAGNKPVIHNNGVIHPHPTRAGSTVSAGVLLFNAEYVHLNNLEITNNNGGNQDEDLFGIYVLGEDTGKYHHQIYIEDNYVHHVNGAVAGKRRGGIHVHGYSPTSSNTATYNDVRIVNNVVDQIGGVGIGSDVDDLVNAHDFAGTHRENAITNLYVAHNWIGNTGRNSVIARDSDYAVYEYNTSANSSRYSTGHSFFNFRTIGLTFQHNEAYGNTGPGNEPDRGGFDADYNSKGTVIQYNYSHSNNWFSGIMKKPNADVTIRYNLSVNDEMGAYFYGFENDADLTDLKIYNNTHYFNGTISPEVFVRDRTPIESTFNNNVFYAAGAGAMGSNADNGTNVTYDTNVYYNIAPPTSEVNGLTQNPLFVSPGAEPHEVDMQFGRDVLAGYMLTANSPYLNSGVTISNNGGRDFWGNPTPNGATDVGASEYGVGSTIPPAATIFTGNLFPASTVANVVAAVPDVTGRTGDDAIASLSQTFQVDSTFDLKTIILDYEYDPAAIPEDILINLEIFEVDDVAASTMTQGASLLTINGLRMPVIGAADEGAIVLDSALTLPATAGTEGYALRITNGGNPGFEWRRTGSSAGSVYASGQAYENGTEKIGGERDFILALSDIDFSAAEGADFDNDGDVDGTDFLTWQRGVGAIDAQNTDGDANQDNAVDSADLEVWEQQYGSLAPLSGVAAVPEPTSLIVCLFAISLTCLSRKRSLITPSINAALLVAILCHQSPASFAGTIYDFELLNGGAVIASDGRDTAYPSVIRVPQWIAPADRAHSDANYYMYYGNHGGKHIRMKWAQTLEGPWTAFDLGGTFNGQSRQGVFDVDADSTRDSYNHVSAPDVHVDDVNQQIVMYFHGQNQPSTTTSGGTSVPRKHESFVTTSASGLNFNDPLHAGGELGNGPKTVTVDNVTRDIWIGEDYQRAFEKDGNWYSIGKRAIINASPDPLDTWAPLSGDPFGEAWTRESTPSDLWTNDANPRGQDDYHSPAATFLASSEFANHPRNPLPGENVFSNGNDERLNHVSVNLVADDALEVFFYVREANSSAPDRYDDIYRVVLDVSDNYFENWEIARDSSGQAYFDVVVTAEEIYDAVEAGNGIGFDPDDYADPVSLGDTHIFVDDDGGKYLFFSYVSSQNGGALGEGQITAVKLNLHPDFDYDDDVDGNDFLKWQRGESFNSLSTSDLTAWGSSYGSIYGTLPATTSLPEPSNSLLVFVALALVLTGTRDCQRLWAKSELH